MPIYGNDIRLNEAYFGKSKDLLEIENQVKTIRNKFRNSYGNNRYFGDFNGDPEVLKLNRLFEKAFGIGCFSINFNRSSILNAFTLPVSYKYDTGLVLNPNKLKQLTYVDENGMKFKKNNNLAIICNINTGLFFNPRFTDGEIVAIILHELGHNFAEALDTRIAMNSMILSHLQVILDIINIINGNLTINSISPQRFNWFGKFEKELRESLYSNCKPIISLYNVGQGFIGALKDAMVNVVYMIMTFNPIAGLSQKIFQKVINTIVRPTAYRNEKIADRFATMHGYSTELTSSLSKMEDSGLGIDIKEAFDSIPVIGGILSLGPCMVGIITGAFDEHPQWSERLEDQIRALEYELNSSSLDPKMKKELQSQIKQIKDLKAKIIKQANNNTLLTDANWIKKWWFSMFADGDTKHQLLGDINRDLDNSVRKLEIKEGYDILGIGQRKFFS